MAYLDLFENEEQKQNMHFFGKLFLWNPLFLSYALHKKRTIKHEYLLVVQKTSME